MSPEKSSSDHAAASADPTGGATSLPLCALLPLSRVLKRDVSLNWGLGGGVCAYTPASTTSSHPPAISLSVRTRARTHARNPPPPSFSLCYIARVCLSRITMGQLGLDIVVMRFFFLNRRNSPFAGTQLFYSSLLTGFGIIV